MDKDELTDEEKVTLVANMDMRQQDDYNEKFYKLLKSQALPDLIQIDNRIRRAIQKFIDGYAEDFGADPHMADTSQDVVVKTALTLGLLKGYELGRKLRHPLTVEPKRI